MVYTFDEVLESLSINVPFGWLAYQYIKLVSFFNRSQLHIKMINLFVQKADTDILVELFQALVSRVLISIMHKICIVLKFFQLPLSVKDNCKLKEMALFLEDFHPKILLNENNTSMMIERSDSLGSHASLLSDRKQIQQLQNSEDIKFEKQIQTKDTFQLEPCSVCNDQAQVTKENEQKQQQLEKTEGTLIYNQQKNNQDINNKIDNKNDNNYVDHVINSSNNDNDNDKSDKESLNKQDINRDGNPIVIEENIQINNAKKSYLDLQQYTKQSNKVIELSFENYKSQRINQDVEKPNDEKELTDQQEYLQDIEEEQEKPIKQFKRTQRSNNLETKRDIHDYQSDMEQSKENICLEEQSDDIRKKKTYLIKNESKVDDSITDSDINSKEQPINTTIMLQQQSNTRQNYKPTMQFTAKKHDEFIESLKKKYSLNNEFAYSIGANPINKIGSNSSSKIAQSAYNKVQTSNNSIIKKKFDIKHNYNYSCCNQQNNQIFDANDIKKDSSDQ